MWRQLPANTTRTGGNPVSYICLGIFPKEAFNDLLVSALDSKVTSPCAIMHLLKNPGLQLPGYHFYWLDLSWFFKWTICWFTSAGLTSADTLGCPSALACFLPRLIPFATVLFLLRWSAVSHLFQSFFWRCCPPQLKQPFCLSCIYSNLISSCCSCAVCLVIASTIVSRSTFYACVFAGASVGFTDIALNNWSTPLIAR